MIEGEKRRFCKRCLLREVPDGEVLAKIVEERIRLMPEELRVSESVYTQRIQACRECGHLMSGTCRLCGCYAELRAAQRNRRCPEVPPKWLENPKEA